MVVVVLPSGAERLVCVGDWIAEGTVLARVHLANGDSYDVRAPINCKLVSAEGGRLVLEPTEGAYWGVLTQEASACFTTWGRVLPARLDKEIEMKCESGWTGDRCTFELGHEGEHSNERPAEVWCDRCDQPSERVIETSAGSRTLCYDHAAELDYKLHSNAWAAR